MKNIAVLIMASLILTLLSAGCSDNTPSPGMEQGNKKLITCSAIGPVAFIAGEIGGDKIMSKSLIPQDKSVHSYLPTPKDVNDMQQAKLFFAVGIPLEEQVLKHILESSKIPVINSAEGVKRMALSEDSKEFEKHGHESEGGGEHHHAADEDQYQDVHVWLSPANNLIIAGNICKALQAADPANAAYYAANLKNFTEKLQVLDERLKNMLAPYKGKKFLVYHPAFGYFGNHYGLIQEAVETGGKSPSPKHLEMLINEARKDNIKIIFVQPQFNEKYADVVAKAVGAKIVRIDPQAPNVLENYNYIAAELARSLDTKPKGN
ncbi:MAG: zinc ABC transporter substrate-binding protein [Victivallaceae bacterium]|jgi:zinc transport system substrate-binding protein